MHVRVERAYERRPVSLYDGYDGCVEWRAVRSGAAIRETPDRSELDGMRDTFAFSDLLRVGYVVTVQKSVVS